MSLHFLQSFRVSKKRVIQKLEDQGPTSKLLKVEEERLAVEQQRLLLEQERLRIETERLHLEQERFRVQQEAVRAGQNQAEGFVQLYNL